MFNRINLRLPHFSLRILLFSFMVFFALVLAAEGCYYYSIRARVKSLYFANTVDALRTSLITEEIKSDRIILFGKVKKIEGRTVELLAKTTKFDLPIEVVVHPDAIFFQSEFNQGVVDTQKQRKLDGDYFNKIRVGGLAGFSGLYPLEEKNFQASFVYIEDSQ